MMNQVGPLKGMDQSLAFLDLVMNAESRKLELEKIEKARAEANQIIALAGKAKQIESLHAAAEEEMSAATKERADAKSYAEKTLAAAGNEAEGIVNLAKGEASAAYSKMKKMRTDLEAREAAVQERLRAVSLRETAVSTEEQRLSEERSSMESRVHEYEERRTKLEQALA